MRLCHGRPGQGAGTDGASAVARRRNAEFAAAPAEGWKWLPEAKALGDAERPLLEGPIGGRQHGAGSGATGPNSATRLASPSMREEAEGAQRGARRMTRPISRNHETELDIPTNENNSDSRFRRGLFRCGPFRQCSAHHQRKF